jgi:hypothetical protein
MAIPRDAMGMDNYKRWERGLPLEKEVKHAPRPEPQPPFVPDQLKFEEIPDQEIKDFSARGRSVKNKDGVRSTGYSFYLEFTNGKIIQGWLPEGEFQKLKARIPKDRTDLLNKIGL